MYLLTLQLSCSLAINPSTNVKVKIPSIMLKILGNLFETWLCMLIHSSLVLRVSPLYRSPSLPDPSYDLRDSVNATALESWDDEFPLTKVTKVPSKVVNPPRVAESPAQFECKVHSILRINGDSLVGHSNIVIGRVVGIHIRGDFITGDGFSMF
ncbi:hypothetical protein QC760_004490 [Botrytis cinerea]